MTRLLICLWLLLGLAACTHTPPTATDPAQRWAGARQLMVVTVSDWDANRGQLRRYERVQGGPWTPVGSVQPVTIGRNGAAWGAGLHPAQATGPQKREGDGRAPAGVFSVGDAFGYAASLPTGLPYVAMTQRHWCVDVPASPLYNQIVDAGVVGDAAVAGSTEPMRRDIHAKGDQRYAKGFVIEHNTANVSGAGSCIFAHLWDAPTSPTAGCTAMSDAAMTEVLGWLRRDAYPVMALLTNAEYARVRIGWSLPELNR